MKLPSFITRGRSRWVFLVLLLILIGVGIWWWTRPSDAEDRQTTRPEYRDLQQVIEFSGVTDASERVAQRFAGGGKLTYVGAKEGDLVKKWQTLATIDARTLQKSLQQQLNTYETQRLTFDTQSDERRGVPQDTAEGRVAQQEQLQLEQSVLGVEIQSLAIEETRLSSPIEGILISAPSAVSGTNISPTDVYEVFNPQTIYFEAYVDEIDVGQVYTGQAAKVRLDAFTETEFTGTVSKVAYRSAATSTGGTVFPIEIRFDTGVDLNKFRLGMSGEAALILEERTHALSLPLEAIITRDGKNYATVLNNETEEEREVETGLETDDYIEIVSGLSEADEVVLP